MKEKSKKENIELAKIIMHGQWFFPDEFNNKMNSIDKLGLQYFEEIYDICEVKNVDVEYCTKENEDNFICPFDFDYNNCQFNTTRKEQMYRFKDSDSRSQEEYKEQMNALRDFNII